MGRRRGLIRGRAAAVRPDWYLLAAIRLEVFQNDVRDLRKCPQLSRTQEVDEVRSYLGKLHRCGRLDRATAQGGQDDLRPRDPFMHSSRQTKPRASMRVT